MDCISGYQQLFGQKQIYSENKTSSLFWVIHLSERGINFNWMTISAKIMSGANCWCNSNIVTLLGQFFFAHLKCYLWSEKIDAILGWDTRGVPGSMPWPYLLTHTSPTTLIPLHTGPTSRVCTKFDNLLTNLSPNWPWHHSPPPDELKNCCFLKLF